MVWQRHTRWNSVSSASPQSRHIGALTYLASYLRFLRPLATSGGGLQRVLLYAVPHVALFANKQATDDTERHAPMKNAVPQPAWLWHGNMQGGGPQGPTRPPRVRRPRAGQNMRHRQCGSGTHGLQESVSRWGRTRKQQRSTAPTHGAQRAAVGHGHSGIAYAQIMSRV